MNTRSTLYIRADDYDRCRIYYDRKQGLHGDGSPVDLVPMGGEGFEHHATWNGSLQDTGTVVLVATQHTSYYGRPRPGLDNFDLYLTLNPGETYIDGERVFFKVEAERLSSVRFRREQLKKAWGR